MAFVEVMGTSEIVPLAAFFIGIMMAMSPCPMATNITAIAAVSRKAGDNRKTLFFGLAYTLGRMFTYVGIAAAIVWIGISTQSISIVLRGGGEFFLGPLLIIIGVLLSGKIRFPSFNIKGVSRLKESLVNKGVVGSFVLGALFALAFCPFSAVLFFGMLIPLAVIMSDALILPSIFAFATGIPVIIFSLILGFGVSRLGSTMNKVNVIDKWTRRIVSLVFIIVGIYCLSVLII
ncbi:aromatic aminobenezylarsenical efflux permease ArsG family transporter [Candidatus Aenigmatarchaeota archaeon]